MTNIARVPITNFFVGGDYTGRIEIGPDEKPLNVILDTGSSALALDGKNYSPELIRGDKTTHLAQTDSYGDEAVGPAPSSKRPLRWGTVLRRYRFPEPTQPSPTLPLPICSRESKGSWAWRTPRWTTPLPCRRIPGLISTPRRR
jgi:hypothetical protein